MPETSRASRAQPTSQCLTARSSTTLFYLKYDTSGSIAMAGPPWMQPRLFHLELEKDTSTPPRFVREKRPQLQISDKTELIALMVNFMMVHEGHFKCLGKSVKNENTLWEFRYIHIFGPNHFVVQCELQPNDGVVEVACREEGNPLNRASINIDPSKFVESVWNCAAASGLTWTAALKNSDILALDVKKNILNMLIENMEPYDIDLEIVSPNPKEVAA